MTDLRPASDAASAAREAGGAKTGRARRWLLAAGILVCTGSGLFLALGGFNRPNLGWPDELALEECRAILNDIGILLREHQARHGTFPTTDEGLASLAVFQARFPVVCTVEDNFWPQTARWVASCGPNDEEQVPWPLIHERPSSPRGPGGVEAVPRESPTGAPELVRLARDVWSEGRSLDAWRVSAFKPRQMRLDLAFGADGTAYLVSPAGILSPSLVPYGYENRRGRPESDFAGSPIPTDTAGRYSLRVDDGVYLYSADGELIARELDAQRAGARTTRWVGAGLLALAAVLIVLALRQRRFVATAVAAGAAVALGLAARQVLVACYKPSVAFTGHPLAAARQRELAEQYHRAGVFTDATYRLVLEVLDAGSPPGRSEPTP